MSSLILPAGMRPTQPPKLEGYSRRQMIALENPEATTPVHPLASNDPHKRKMRLVDNKYQVISLLTVDPDSPWVWHGTVGVMQNDSFEAPIWMWSDEIEVVLRKELNEILRLPRPIERYMDARRPAGRPTSLHRFIPLTRREIDHLEIVDGGAVKRSIRLRGPDGIWR